MSASGDVTDAADADGSEAGTGAMAGVLTGLGLGALAGLGVLSGVIPVIGPAIAGGTLGIILSNAAVGAGVGGLVGALVGAGIPEDEAHYYQGEFESGRTIVTVQAAGRADEAMAILRRYGGYDMSTRPDYSGTMASSACREQADGHPRPERGRDRQRADRGHGPGRHGRSRHRPHRALRTTPAKTGPASSREAQAPRSWKPPGDAPVFRSSSPPSRPAAWCPTSARPRLSGHVQPHPLAAVPVSLARAPCFPRSPSRGHRRPCLLRAPKRTPSGGRAPRRAPQPDPERRMQ